MKAIMISKPPKIVANVLNDLASILIFKTCPKDWKDYLSGKTKEMPESTDVYIYCTKDKNHYLYWDWYDPPYVTHEWFVSTNPHIWNEDRKNINGWFNGRVIAKFTLNKVEKFDARLGHPKIYCEACVGDTELLENHYYDKEYNAYAWHIDNLEIFDKPKVLYEFKIKGNCKNCNSYCPGPATFWNKKRNCFKVLAKAPQSFMYVDVD